MDLKPYMSETIKLIHSTTSINAIKQLITIYELLEINAKIKETFKDDVWDFSALQDINHYRRELYLYHFKEFQPRELLISYNARLISLLSTIQFKNENQNLGKIEN